LAMSALPVAALEAWMVWRKAQLNAN
jgi:hypothetical protein